MPLATELLRTGRSSEPAIGQVRPLWLTPQGRPRLGRHERRRRPASGSITIASGLQHTKQHPALRDEVTADRHCIDSCAFEVEIETNSTLRCRSQYRRSIRFHVLDEFTASTGILASWH